VVRAQQAERRRAALIDQIIQGRAPQARATVSDLIDRWLSVAELELITTVNYQSYIERVTSAAFWPKLKCPAALP
jgi:hypothetical protein